MKTRITSTKGTNYNGYGLWNLDTILRNGSHHFFNKCVARNHQKRNNAGDEHSQIILSRIVNLIQFFPVTAKNMKIPANRRAICHKATRRRVMIIFTEYVGIHYLYTLGILATLLGLCNRNNM